MDELDFVVKVGGGAITNKNALETSRKEVICKVTDVLAQCYRAGMRFIVMHGAGSFGHHQCKEYHVNDGYRNCDSDETAQQRKIGFSLGRASVSKLSLILISELIKSGVPAVLVSTFSSWQTDNGKVVKSDFDIIEHSLAEHFVPVLSGDVVFDLTKGCNVLSSDVLLQVMCERFRVKRAVFLMDCPGIFTHPPEQSGAELLPELMIEENGTISIPLEMNCTVPDVSGGIRSKLELGAQIVVKHCGRIPVFFCSADSEALFKICMFGDPQDCPATVLCLATPALLK